jgi:hypothetical protein
MTPKKQVVIPRIFSFFIAIIAWFGISYGITIYAKHRDLEALHASIDSLLQGKDIVLEQIQLPCKIGTSNFMTNHKRHGRFKTKTE